MGLRAFVADKIDFVSLIAIALSLIALAYQLYNNFLAQALTLHPPQRPAIAFYLGGRDKGWLTVVTTLSVSYLSERRHETAVVKADVHLNFYGGSPEFVSTKLHWQHFVNVDTHLIGSNGLPSITKALDAGPFVVANGNTVSRTIWFAPRSENCAHKDCPGSYRLYADFLKPSLESASNVELKSLVSG